MKSKKSSPTWSRPADKKIVGKTSFEEPLIQPMRVPGDPDAGPLCLLCSSADDLRSLGRALGFDLARSRAMIMSRLYAASPKASGCSLAGPAVGAPYAAITLERLITCGVKSLVYWGWCGSLSPDLPVGSVVLADGAFIDEGTSSHYLGTGPHGDFPEHIPCPAPDLLSDIRSAVKETGTVFQTGPVWTTDSPFRETPSKVAAYASQGALAVEMEVSALYTVAAHRGIECAAVLVVSDELHQGKWNPGFKHPRFGTGRKAVEEVLVNHAGTKKHHRPG